MTGFMLCNYCFSTRF